ncbi:hypothetical protein BBJ28_00005070, partial [Nothophytophthora sp. Chile5]
FPSVLDLNYHGFSLINEAITKVESNYAAQGVLMDLFEFYLHHAITMIKGIGENTPSIAGSVLVNVAPELARKAEAQSQAAVNQRLVTEHELALLEEELDHDHRALQPTLLAEQQQRNEQLRVQLVDANDAEAAMLRESFQVERLPQEHALQEHIQKEDAALAAVLAAQEQDASVAIERKQKEELHALQRQKQ